MVQLEHLEGRDVASMEATGDTRDSQREAAATTRSDAAPVWQLALRDTAIVAAALSLWAAADAWTLVSDLGFASTLAAVDGLLVGAFVTAMAHEWGHFAGARWGGGIAPTTAFARFLPLFVFDLERSDTRSFRWMGIGGNAAHWSVVLLFALSLPLTTPGRVALLSAALGFAVFASVTEAPVLRRSLEGASAQQSFAGITDTLGRNGAVGAATAALVFLLLV